ncbi:MAG: amidohydrolase family protein [Rhodothermales bacterium]|nr:amidohydrolase family protein [Rhodothermales bacterium]
MKPSVLGHGIGCRLRPDSSIAALVGHQLVQHLLMIRPFSSIVRSLLIAFAVGLVAMSTTQVVAAQDVTVFKGATLLPITSDPIENGVLVVEGSRIRSLGPEAAVRYPSDATVIDVSGTVLMPGLVDTHSHLGGVQGGDASAALHPDVRTLDAINVRSKTFNRARAGGITTLNVMSGSGHLMSGQTTYLKSRKVGTIGEALFCADPLTEVCGGMKMANGTNSIRSNRDAFPGTRARSAAMARRLFFEALDYRQKIQQAQNDPAKMPARDIRLEAVLEVIDGRRIVQFHTHRHDDILTAIRLSREFGFRMVLHHVSEAWKVAEEIGEAGIPCSVIVIDSPGGKLEAAELSFETGAALEAAGVTVAFHTDDYITDSRLFLRSAAFGVRGGMSRQKALESVTIAGATMLGLDDRVGSLEPGKDADFVILSGDPLSVYTKVEQTWIDGVKVFDLDNADDRAYALGGYDVYTEPFEFQHEALGEWGN